MKSSKVNYTFHVTTRHVQKQVIVSLIHKNFFIIYYTVILKTKNKKLKGGWGRTCKDYVFCKQPKITDHSFIMTSHTFLYSNGQKKRNFHEKNLFFIFLQSSDILKMQTLKWRKRAGHFLWLFCFAKFIRSTCLTGQ